MDGPEYRAIAAHYGERRAQRSGERLMKHVDDGLRILRAIGTSDDALRAFCLHPLVQSDGDLAVNGPRIEELSPSVRVVMLAMEYRNIANATLSTREIAGAADIPLSPLPEVNAMLVADKVQNRVDFLRHHRERHPRREALDRYFARWLERLGIDEVRYATLAALCATEAP